MQARKPWPPSCTIEPDFRQVGEALCPERFPLEKLAMMEHKMGPYYWAALMQQRPRPPQGSTFQYDWFKWLDACPTNAVLRVRYWDLAGTEDGGDFTSGARLSLTADSRITIEDVVRGQWSVGRRDEMIKATAEADRKLFGPGRVVQWLETESGIGGKDRTVAIVRKLNGHIVYTEPATGDKELRAEPVAGQAELGNVWVVRHPSWNGPVMEVLCDFPHGEHDDDVDSISGAHNKLTEALDQQFSIGRFRS